MKTFEEFQNEMIIDRRNIVSKTRIFTEFTLNTFGWILWIFLFRPLFMIALWYISYRFFKYHMFELEGFKNPEFFGIGAGTVLLIFLSLFAWSRYNAWRFGGLDRRKSRGEAGVAEIAKYYKITEEQAEKLRKSRIIYANFDKSETVRLKTEDGIEFEALYAPLNQAKHKQNN